MARPEHHEANRRSWNHATRVHNAHKVDQARFLREGGELLFPEELDLLGDLAGTRLVHLSCNAGQDSLCLARRGASVTGVDISDEAIDFARRLSDDAGIPAEFERADVYDWLPEAAAAGRTFDLAFASYGVIHWLSDMELWARGIHGVLAPGGRFVLVEYHPMMMVFDDAGTRRYPYFTYGAAVEQAGGVVDYVGAAGPALAPSGFVEAETGFENPAPTFEYDWTLGEVVSAVAGAGLVVERLEEYPHSNGFQGFETMREAPGRRFVLPEDEPDLPMMFGLVARRALAHDPDHGWARGARARLER